MKHLIPGMALLALLGVAALPAQAGGKVCKLEIAGTDLMQFDKKELHVAPGCTEVQLTLRHSGQLPAQAMGHNWVLVKAADASAVANAGMSAGLAKDYVTPGDERVIAHTKIIGGGQSASVSFLVAALAKGESYLYICTFPGHSALMKGKLIVD